MSAYKGLDLFGSGPHRFASGRRGHLVLSAFALGGSPLPNSYPIGLQDWDVVVTGRLVGGSEGALRTLRDAVVAQLEPLDSITPGILTDGLGRSWSGMVLVSYEEAARRDRGRVWSIGYTATFRHFEALDFSALVGG